MSPHGVGASIAYVDRPTVEAHLERPLSDPEWAAVSQQFTAMAFDDHVGDTGSLRTPTRLAPGSGTRRWPDPWGAGAARRPAAPGGHL